MDYDVIILGGGLAGCATACALSKYNLNIAVIERNFDIAEDVAPIITSFVSDGSDIESDFIYKYIKESREELLKLAEEINLDYRIEPSFSVYESDEEFKEVLKRIEDRGIEGVRQVDYEFAQKLTPHIKENAKNILYHENTGIISPYDLATALGEIAFDNGVRFRLEEEVKAIERVSRDEVRVITDKSKYSCRVVVITAFNDLYLGHKEAKVAEKTIPLETMLLEKNFATDIKTMINIFREDGNATSIMPTFSGKSVVTIESPEKIDYKSVKKMAEAVIGPFPSERVDLLTVNNFYQDPVILTDLLDEEGYINMYAKNHNLPGILPMITNRVTELVVSKFKARENGDYVFKRRQYFNFRDMSNEERNEAIAFDERFGKMICTCSMVTEGEIVNAIRRPLGARTIEGVRRRTGIVFGSCQGAYCLNKVLKILSKELDKKPEEILNDRKNSRILAARIKEFDSI